MNRLEAILPDADWTYRPEKRPLVYGKGGYCIEAKWEEMPDFYPPDKFEFAQDIWKALKEAPLRKMQRELEQLKQQVAELRAVVFPAAIPKVGTFDKWLSSEDAKQYAGQYVAYLPGEGVIAVKATADALMDAIEEHPRQDDMSVAIVPTCQVALA